MPVSSEGKVDNFVLKMIAKNITKAKRCDNLPIILPNYFLHSRYKEDITVSAFGIDLQHMEIPRFVVFTCA